MPLSWPRRAICCTASLRRSRHAFGALRHVQHAPQAHFRTKAPPCARCAPMALFPRLVVETCRPARASPGFTAKTGRHAGHAPLAPSRKRRGRWHARLAPTTSAGPRRQVETAAAVRATGGTASTGCCSTHPPAARRATALRARRPFSPRPRRPIRLRLRAFWQSGPSAKEGLSTRVPVCLLV